MWTLIATSPSQDLLISRAWDLGFNFLKKHTFLSGYADIDSIVTKM